MSTFFEATILDDGTKEQLCLDLLAEFGARNVRRANTRGEIIHSCCLPFGAHKNGDANPSASLNFKKLTYRCLGCGSGGGFLWFIAVCRGEDGAQARNWLENQTGTGRQVQDLGVLLKILDAMYQGASTIVQQIPQYSASVLDPWTWPTFHPYMTDGVPELGYRGRGIPEETLQHFRVGYTDNYFDGSERIIIPLWWQEKLVGWQARRVNSKDEPKYRNSPDFPRDQVLYNYTRGADTVLVESPLSVLRHYHHQPGLQATFGAAVTDMQIPLIRQARKLTLWFDNDKAGWAATERLIAETSRFTDVFVVDNPYNADPADMDDDTVADLIENAIPWGLWNVPTELITWKGDE